MAEQVSRYKSKYSCFEKFQYSKIAFETKKTYTKYLKEFLKFCQFSEYERLMEMSDPEKYESIMDYLINLTVERKLSHTVSMNAYSAIKKFFWNKQCQIGLGTNIKQLY